MFEVGFTELLLLALIALLVLGPEKLPRIARTLGGLSRKARSSWLNLKRSIEAEIRAEELKEPLDRLRADIRGARDRVEATTTRVKADVDAVLNPTAKPPPDRPDGA